jgi:hypothetical protein
MKIDWQSPFKLAAYITAFGVIGGASLALGDATGWRPVILNEFRVAMEQTEQNTLAMAKLQFDILWGKKQFGSLSFEEKVSLCKTAQILNYSLRTEKGEPECTPNGEPILTFQAN